MPQITGRMTADERTRFGDYARGLRLDGGTVATLLLTRELRVGRLTALHSDPRFYKPGKTPGKITLRRLPEAEKLDFREHARKHEITPSQALGLLCRVELVEKWLARALDDPGKRLGASRKLTRRES